MTREEFFEKKVLTEDECDHVNNAFTKAEDACMDIMLDIRAEIEDVMTKLEVREGCMTLETQNHLLVSKDGRIMVDKVIYLDDIKSVDALMDIFAEVSC
jgi:cation transport regulator ChaC